jgi:hypothetical protein
MESTVPSEALPFTNHVMGARSMCFLLGIPRTSATMRVIVRKRVQVDEIWSFTAAKQKNFAKMKAAVSGAGDTSTVG